MGDAEGAGANPEGTPPPRHPVFAVRTTPGHETEVVQGIRSRALMEKLDIRAAIHPRGASGYVLVEAPDFDRLTNLVASVRHARGVVTPPSASPGEGAAAIPTESVAAILGAERAPDLDEVLEALVAPPGAAVRAQPEPEQIEKLRRAAKRGPPAATSRAPTRATPRARGELPALSPRAARALNIIAIAPLAALALAALAAPHALWDNLLYPYFWRSIESDANNVGGSAEAYNIVDTLTYALILVPAVILIYRVLERLKIRVDSGFILMLTPFLVLGGAARALEDSVYFAKPLTYVFISPIIYIAEGLFVLLLVVASWWVAREVKGRGMARGALAWSAAFAPGAAALVYLQVADTRLVTAPIPAPILLSALACAYLAGLVLVNRAVAPGFHGFVLNAGVLLCGLSAYLIARWIALGGWFPDMAQRAATHTDTAPAILGVACLASALTLLGLYFASLRFRSLSNMLTPINALVLFGQFLDGTATFWGISMFGYQEKHVLPGFLISVTGTAGVMFPLKFVFATGVLYITDVVYRKDLYGSDGEMTSFAGLLKLTVAALGMGPGTRDMLRLAMGV